MEETQTEKTGTDRRNRHGRRRQAQVEAECLASPFFLFLVSRGPSVDSVCFSAFVKREQVAVITGYYFGLLGIS